MIKVIPKIVMILELIAKNGEMNFTDLTVQSGLSRSNMSHLLKSLCENGLLIRKQHGRYATGEKLYTLCASVDLKVALNQIVNRCAGNVMREFEELAVVGMCHHGQRLTLAKCRPVKNFQIDESGDQHAGGGWYNTASGRILLAFQSDKEIKQIVDEYGLPAKTLWSEASTFERMNRELAVIRERRAVFMDVDEQIFAIGVPAVDAAGVSAFSVSMACLKMFRKSTDEEIAARLRVHAEIMSKEIKFNRIIVAELEL